MNFSQRMREILNPFNAMETAIQIESFIYKNVDLHFSSKAAGTCLTDWF